MTITRKRNPAVTLNSVLHQEVRRHYCGSIYWVRCISPAADSWALTADGMHIGGPYRTRETAIAALDAVAPVEAV